MGNLFTRERIQNLEARLAKSELRQQNNVSRQELDEWKYHHEDSIKSFKERITIEKMQQYQIQMADLRKQIETLKYINQELEKKLDQQDQSNNSSGRSSGLSNKQTNKRTNKSNEKLKRSNKSNIKSNQIFVEGISKQRIAELSEKWIKNTAINIPYFPDAIEQQLYKNMINIVLGVLQESVESIHMEFMGHVMEAPRFGYYQSPPANQQPIIQTNQQPIIQTNQQLSDQQLSDQQLNNPDLENI